MIQKLGVLAAIVIALMPAASACGGALSFDPVTGAAGYKVYIAATHDEVLYKKVAPIDIGARTSYCFSARKDIPGYFVSVSAYTAMGKESEVYQPIAYHLNGNIIGDWYDGTSWDLAKVDGADLALITSKQYFGKTVTHQYIDCTIDFVIEIPSLMQKLDLNGDGRIDGRDLSLFGQCWQHVLPSAP